jgi:outer membrane autotransporter protein
VARVLNELVPTATGAMADVVNHLYALSEDDALRSIRSLGGGIHQQAATATLGGVRTFTDMNLGRLGRSAPSSATDPEPARQSYRRSASATARVTDWLGAERASGWWIRGLAGDSRLPGEGSDPGATVPTRGVVIGFDRAVTPRLALGVSGARTDPEVRQEGSFDHTTSRMLHAGLYGTYRFGASRVSAAVGVGNQRYRTRREIFASDDPSFAAADYDGRSYSGQIEFRHGVRLGGGVSVEAELGLQAAALTFDAISEEGAGVVGLVLPHRRVESQRSLVGGTIYKSFGDGPRPRLTLEGRAAWAHEFDARAAMATRFLGDTQTGGFQIAPAGQLRDSAVLGASIYSGVWERVRLFADVTSEVGGPVRTIAGSVGIGWKW